MSNSEETKKAKRRVKKATKKSGPDTPRTPTREAVESDLKLIPMSSEFDGSDKLRPHNMAAVDRLLDDCKEIIGGIKRGDNVIVEVVTVVPTLMEMVRSYPGLRGLEKKIVVLKVIRQILSEVEMTRETHSAVDMAVTFLVPCLIDMIVAAADGKYELGRKWRNVKKSWNLMVGCCGCACCKSACTCTD